MESDRKYDTRETQEDLLNAEFTGSKATHPEMVDAIREAVPGCKALFPCAVCKKPRNTEFGTGKSTAGTCACEEWQAPDDLFAELSDEEVYRVYLHIVVHPLRQESRYLAYAKKHYASDGDLEFDENAVVSLSDDGGAYVACWKWITDEEAGVEKEEAQ